jgi:pimeloyl-ACP methyl ester carboxylesterase
MQTLSGTAAYGEDVVIFYEDRRITAPTVVIHDSEDPMVRPPNGRSVARAIGGARYVVVDGTGHDLPKPVSRAVVEALTENMAFVTM